MIETSTIYPTNKHSRPSPPTKIPLHGLDLMDPPIQILNHRFYRLPKLDHSSFTNDVVEKLKSSLAEALELYPPVAGTVRENPQENGDGYIAMDAENIQGTPFLVEIKDVPYTGDSEDLSPRTTLLLPPLSSTLAVKITRFSCGTVAVAASIHHQVCDLRGFLDFLEVWAQIARGEPIDFTKIPDDWSRTPGRFFFGLIDQSTVPTPPPPFTLLPAASTVPSPFPSAEVSNWKFTKDNVERLKNDLSPCSKEETSDQWISSGDALTALIWGAITRVRKRSSSESQVGTIAMAADGRDRSPGENMVDGRYFGNFNCLFSVTVPRCDLLSSACESASRVALEIRNAVNIQLSSEAIANKIAFFERTENIRPPGRIVWTSDAVVTNWCRFDLQGPKLDFGWGKPFCATGGAGVVYPPGYSRLTQDKSSGDVFLLIAVEQTAANELKTDLLLNKYATLI